MNAGLSSGLELWAALDVVLLETCGRSSSCLPRERSVFLHRDIEGRLLLSLFSESCSFCCSSSSAAPLSSSSSSSSSSSF